MPGRRFIAPEDRRILRKAEVRRFDLPHGFLRVFHWGESGPLVLLAHGWSSCAARLVDFVEPLMSAGFQVVGFDAPGHGASSGFRSDLPRYRYTSLPTAG
jgi:alpha-beta hydrolase superfamily lysophospholipase